MLRIVGANRCPLFSDEVPYPDSTVFGDRQPIPRTVSVSVCVCVFVRVRVSM